ncbi:ATP-binding protein, partial [Lacticaseibacillus rhamnosus]
MTAISWFWLVAFGLLVVGCMSQLWWIFRRQQNWPVRWLNLIIVIVSL